MISKKKDKKTKEERTMITEGDEEGAPLDEKKKILDFIKKANEKKAKGVSKSK